MTVSVDNTSPSARVLSIPEGRLCQHATQALPSWFVIKQGKAKMVGLSTVERLLDFFGCEVKDLIVYE